MKILSRFFKENKKILLFLGVIAALNAFLFYFDQGLVRERAVNIVYVTFVERFPESIRSARLEPLFIFILWSLVNLFKAAPELMIGVVKNLLILFQLFVFFKIIKQYIKNDVVALFSVFGLGFSFSFFSIADNLLRNHFANLIFLILLYCIVVLFKNNKTFGFKKQLITGIFLGLLIYSHILPTIIINLLLISLVLFLLFILIFKKFIKSKNVAKPTILDHILSFMSVILLFAAVINTLSITSLVYLLVPLAVFYLLSLKWPIYQMFQAINRKGIMVGLAVILLVTGLFFESPYFDRGILVLMAWILNYLLLLLIRHYQPAIKKNHAGDLIKKLLIILIIGGVLQVPQIMRYLTQSTDISDFQLSLSAVADDGGIATTGGIVATVVSIIREITIDLFKVGRTIFEVRIPAFPFLFMMSILFIAIYYLIRKKISYLPIVFLWLITYIGSKVDLLFRIDTLSYRFSIMSIFAGIIILFTFSFQIIRSIKSRVIKLIILLFITFNLLSASLPVIIENTFLRNFDYNDQKKVILEEIFQKDVLVENCKTESGGKFYFTNNMAFRDDYELDGPFLHNGFIYSSDDVGAVADYFRELNKGTCVIFDHYKIGVSGNDVGSEVGTNYQSYLESPEYIKLTEVIAPQVHLSFFKLLEEDEMVNLVYEVGYVECDNPEVCSEEMEEDLSPGSGVEIVEHVSEIVIGRENVMGQDYIKLSNGKQFIIDHNPKHTFQKKTLYKQNQLDLLVFGSEKVENIEVILNISDRILINKENFDVNRIDLEEPSANRLLVWLKPRQNTISYQGITRGSFQTLVKVVLFIIFLIISAIIYYIKKEGIKQLSDKQKKYILAGLVIICIDGLFVTQFVILLYKILLGV